MRTKRNEHKRLNQLKDNLLVVYKDQEVKRLERMFVYSNHAKIRISERYWYLTKQEVLDDIKNNYQQIIAQKDRAFQIITTSKTYIFSKDYLMITTYYNKSLADCPNT